MKPIMRGSTYHIKRRVPRRFARIEDRTEIWISLWTDSLTEATSKAPAVWNLMIRAWEARLKATRQTRKPVNGGVKTGHAAAQNQASGGVLSAMARALSR